MICEVLKPFSGNPCINRAKYKSHKTGKLICEICHTWMFEFLLLKDKNGIKYRADNSLAAKWLTAVGEIEPAFQVFI